MTMRERSSRARRIAGLVVVAVLALALLLGVAGAVVASRTGDDVDWSTRVRYGDRVLDSDADRILLGEQDGKGISLVSTDDGTVIREVATPGLDDDSAVLTADGWLGLVAGDNAHGAALAFWSEEAGGDQPDWAVPAGHDPMVVGVTDDVVAVADLGAHRLLGRSVDDGTRRWATTFGRILQSRFSADQHGPSEVIALLPRDAARPVALEIADGTVAFSLPVRPDQARAEPFTTETTDRSVVVTLDDGPTTIVTADGATAVPSLPDGGLSMLRPGDGAARFATGEDTYGLDLAGGEAHVLPRGDEPGVTPYDPPYGAAGRYSIVRLSGASDVVDTLSGDVVARRDDDTSLVAEGADGVLAERPLGRLSLWRYGFDHHRARELFVIDADGTVRGSLHLPDFVDDAAMLRSGTGAVVLTDEEGSDDSDVVTLIGR